MSTSSTAALAALPTDARALLNHAFVVSERIGRKFDISDLRDDTRLTQAADIYARTYEGDFPFMVEMAEAVQLHGWLTVGQAKGTLNCLAAEGRRRKAAAARAKAAAGAPLAERTAAQPKVDLAAIPDGTFTVIFTEAEHCTIRLSTAKNGGKRWITYLMGSDNERDFQWFGTIFPDGGMHVKDGYPRQRAALDVVLNGDRAKLTELGAAYAMRSNRCWRCARKLTVPASIHSGLGPDCAAQMDADYSSPPAPVAPAAAVADTDTDTASVQAAQVALAAIGAAPVPSLPKASLAPGVSRAARGYVNTDGRRCDDLGRLIAPTAAELGRPRTFEDIFGEDAA